MSTLENKSGLTEAEVESGMDFADAAQYLARGRADNRPRDLSREILRGNMTREEALKLYMSEILPEEP